MICAICFLTRVYNFPALDALPFEVLAQSHETRRQRLEVLEGLLSRKTKVVITTLEALCKTLMPPEDFAKALIRYEVGQRVNMEELLLIW